MYRLKLLGGAILESDGTPIAGRAVQRRRVALLAILALGRSHAAPREKVAAMLWPEADADRARHLISDSVYRINQVLDGPAVVAVGAELRLDVAVLEVDAILFSSSVGAGEWGAASSLYGGPFLDGFFVPDAQDFERWVDAERSRCAREYMQALEALAVGAEHASDHARAVDYWRRAAVQDPHSSRIAMRLMLALAAAGERLAAIKHLRIHTELVWQDLGVLPDPEVTRLADRLRAIESEAPLREDPVRLDPVRLDSVRPDPIREDRTLLDPVSEVPVYDDPLRACPVRGSDSGGSHFRRSH